MCFAWQSSACGPLAPPHIVQHVAYSPNAKRAHPNAHGDRRVCFAEQSCACGPVVPRQRVQHVTNSPNDVRPHPNAQLSPTTTQSPSSSLGPTPGAAPPAVPAWLLSSSLSRTKCGMASLLLDIVGSIPARVPSDTGRSSVGSNFDFRTVPSSSRVECGRTAINRSPSHPSRCVSEVAESVCDSFAR
jgi:hypothetical protein